jgi:hypothetical protein
MTGISDVFKSAQNVLQHANLWLVCALNLLPERVAEQARLLFPNALVITQSITCPQPIIPDPRPTMRLSQGGKIKPATTPIAYQKEDKTLSTHWSLLLPMTSRGQEEEVFWIRLENTVKKLGLSVHVHDMVNHKCKTELRIAVDVRDPVLDNEPARQRISAMVAEHAHRVDLVFEEPLPPAFEGKLCWIWGRMARNAVDSGADYILLIGDDVELLTPGWQTEVEVEFSNIATRTGLSLGAACVALRDASFPAFPTFPVINRFHLEVFGELFPDEFRNQHGDPFLFELYRRFGAACFAPTASVCNAVGGRESARYGKEDAESVWHCAILSRAVAQLQSAIEPAGAVRTPCIDVVIPTFRCDLEALVRLTSICFSNGGNASLKILSLWTVLIPRTWLSCARP